MKYARTDRISEEIKKALSGIIMYELKDPEMTGMISITDVETTKDLSYSKVFVSILGSNADKDKSLSILKRSAGYIRKLLSSKVKIRHTPELLFELDNSIEYGMHMNEVLSKISVKEEEDNGAK